MAHVLHPRKAVAPPFMQKRLSDLDLHQIARCAPSGWPMQTVPDIPRMTPKPAWRVAILQRPWKPDGRYGWLPEPDGGSSSKIGKVRFSREADIVVDRYSIIVQYPTMRVGSLLALWPGDQTNCGVARYHSACHGGRAGHNNGS